MAYVPGVALLAALVVGCSAGADSNANGTDSKAGTPTVTPAPPGKYLTLPAPCRAVPRSTLKDLLPGAAELPGDQQDKVFRGSAAVTYDTDRKVGCSWKADGPNATRSLSIDLERVVSYDPAVSDDDRADTVYAKKEKAAGLSSSATPGPPDEKDKKDKKGEASEGAGRRRIRLTATPTPRIPPAPHPPEATTQAAVKAPAGPPEAAAARRRPSPPASSTTSEMPHSSRICPKRQVPPHSTTR